MIFKNTIIAKYYVLIVVTLTLFIMMGIISCQYLIKNIFPEKETMPPLFIAKMIDLIDPQDKMKGIKRFINLKSGMSGPSLELINAQGNVVYSSHSESKKSDITDLHRLAKPYDYISINQSTEKKYDFFYRHFFKFRPLKSVFLVRMTGEPAYYLKIIPSAYKDKENKSLLFFIFTLIALLISLLLGAAMSIYMIYLSLIKHWKVVDHVISELQKGNLKARFPIDRMDELGRAMHKFNKMADEIEQLVLNSKQVEQRRINLLQELMHDLRTPVSSLKMLLEILATKHPHMTDNLKNELIELSRKEVDYFAKLMDDLLLLARMSEPKYQIRRETVNLHQMLTEIIDDADFRESQTNNNKKIVRKFSDDSKYIYGDAHLLRRAFRNALENAIFYSTTVVSIDVELLDEQYLKVIIQDDGSGFSEETIHTFGERLFSRKISDKSGTKVSLGLGSVIIKTVCELHAAKLILNNTINAAQQVLGARLEMELPYS